MKVVCDSAPSDEPLAGDALSSSHGMAPEMGAGALPDRAPTTALPSIAIHVGPP